VSVDPLQFDYPYYTPFQYTGNNPVTFTDLDGRETSNNDNTGVDTNGQQKDDGKFQFSDWKSKDSYYVTGFALGLADGIYETLDIAQNILTRYSQFAILYNVVSDAINGRKFLESYSKENEMIALIGATVRNKEQLGKIWDELKKNLGDWWEDASFQDDMASAGYEHGKLVFEIIGMFFGYGDVKALLKTGKLSSNLLGKLKNLKKLKNIKIGVEPGVFSSG
jgi:hypothetical protein